MVIHPSTRNDREGREGYHTDHGRTQLQDDRDHAAFAALLQVLPEVLDPRAQVDVCEHPRDAADCTGPHVVSEAHVSLHVPQKQPFEQDQLAKTSLQE